MRHMVKLTVYFPLETMTENAKNALIAPKISEFVSPGIPDIFERRKYLLNAFILNVELSITIKNRHRQLIFNMIRKVEGAFSEYCRARECVYDYIKARHESVSEYFSALRHFEHCLAHLYEAVSCMNALTRKFDGPQQFHRDDGSVLQRVHAMHTAIKHMDEYFEKGKSGDKLSFSVLSTRTGSSENLSDKDAVEIANVPMWLTDSHLECASAAVSYKELAQEILDFCGEAEKLAIMKKRRNEK